MRRPAGHKQPFSFRGFPDSASSPSIPVSAYAVHNIAIPYITYKIRTKEIHNRKHREMVGRRSRIKIEDYLEFVFKRKRHSREERYNGNMYVTM